MPFILVKFKQEVEQKRGTVVLQCFVVEEHFTHQAKIFAGHPVVVSVKFKNADIRIKVDLVSRDLTGALGSVAIELLSLYEK